ncbi:MAG: hypothetical protein WCC87_08585 [Candidatus Korobacteraceae bacterium]
MPDELLKQSKIVENHGDAADDCGSLMKHFHNRLTLDNLRLSERYVKKEIHVLLHFKVGDSEEFVASFQRETFGLVRHEHTPQVGSPLPGMAGEVDSLKIGAFTWQDTMAANIGKYGEQQVMLVDTVELMDVPEDLSGPSSVWFDCVDLFYRLIPHALYTSVPHGFVFRGVFGNGKANVPERADSACSNRNQMDGQMVKRTPEIVSHVSHYRGNVRGDVLEHSQVVRALTHVRIILERNRICACVAEGSPSGLQFLDLLFGPFDLCPKPLENLR